MVASDPGLYLLPAAIFARTASRFKSDIAVSNNELTVDGKSTMGLMSLCATKGTVLTVTARGVDSSEALQAVESFLIAPFKGERDRMAAPNSKGAYRKETAWPGTGRRGAVTAELPERMLAPTF